MRRRRSRMNCEPLTRDYVTIREYLAHLSATSDFVADVHNTSYAKLHMRSFRPMQADTHNLINTLPDYT